MKTIIAKTFRFDKGQLQVILLPEEIGGIIANSKEEAKMMLDDYKQACAYAHAHPIDVHPDSAYKIRWLIYCSKGKQYDGEWAWNNWQPADLTEYKLEVRMEIKEMCASDICDTDGACEHCRESKQVACLIEDDKQFKSNNMETTNGTLIEERLSYIIEQLQLTLENVKSGTVTIQDSVLDEVEKSIEPIV